MGLCPRHPCGSSQLSPKPLAGFRGLLLRREGRYGKRRRREKREKRREEGEGRE